MESRKCIRSSERKSGEKEKGKNIHARPFTLRISNFTFAYRYMFHLKYATSLPSLASLISFFANRSFSYSLQHPTISSLLQPHLLLSSLLRTHLHSVSATPRPAWLYIVILQTPYSSPLSHFFLAERFPAPLWSSLSLSVRVLFSLKSFSDPECLSTLPLYHCTIYDLFFFPISSNLTFSLRLLSLCVCSLFFIAHSYFFFHTFTCYVLPYIYLFFFPSVLPSSTLLCFSQPLSTSPDFLSSPHHIPPSASPPRPVLPPPPPLPTLPVSVLGSHFKANVINILTVMYLEYCIC